MCVFLFGLGLSTSRKKEANWKCLSRPWEDWQCASVCACMYACLRSSFDTRKMVHCMAFRPKSVMHICAVNPIKNMGRVNFCSADNLQSRFSQMNHEVSKMGFFSEIHCLDYFPVLPNNCNLSCFISLLYIYRCLSRWGICILGSSAILGADWWLAYLVSFHLWDMKDTAVPQGKKKPSKL